MKSETNLILSEAVHSWLEYITGNCAEATLNNYKRCMTHFTDFFFDDNLEDITTEQIEKFLLDLRMKKSTKNIYIIALKSFFRKMNEWYGLLPNPAVKIKKFKVLAYKRRFLTDEEYEKILAACEPLDKAIVEFVSNTGLRSAEFMALAKSNIRGDMLYIVGKGSKERAVPLNATARRSLEYLIFSPDEKSTVASCLGIGRSGVYQILCRLAKRSGIPKFSTHSLRRHFANEMRRHVDLYVLSQLLGHQSLETTQAYLSCQPDELKGVTDFLDK